MKITYGDYEICGELETPSGFSSSLKRLCQSDATIGSQSIIVSDCGNAKYDLSFGLERAHKNPARAQEALFEFVRDISSRSPADLKIHFGEQKSDKNFSIKNATLVRCRSSIEGRITKYSLEFSAGTEE